MKKARVDQLVIYRQGSLGDTVVALPCFKHIRRFYPNATIHVITNKPISSQACAIERVIEGMGLVDYFHTYSPTASFAKKSIQIIQHIHNISPDLFFYLLENPKSSQIWRDYCFFKLFYRKPLIGLSPFHQYDYKYDAVSGLYEHESRRLARQIEYALGDIDWSDPDLMDLKLSHEELEQVISELPDWVLSGRFFACSIGTKLALKDWGDENWFEFLTRLNQLYPDYGLVFVGAPIEAKRSQALLDVWRGRTLNLCHDYSIRQMASFMSIAPVYIGHDSGPMHLAAAAGSRCVAIFSQHNKPGCWYPWGRHSVLYPANNGIQSITVDEVLAAVSDVMGNVSR